MQVILREMFLNKAGLFLKETLCCLIKMFCYMRLILSPGILPLKGHCNECTNNPVDFSLQIPQFPVHVLQSGCYFNNLLFYI